MRRARFLRRSRWTTGVLLVSIIAVPIVSRFNTVVVGMMVDRSYHRLLHLDWIHADVDGDGLREFVPHDDQTGPDEPDRPYALFLATGTASAEPEEKRRFYMGGKIYEGWSTVPVQYKAPDYSRPGPSRHAVKIFSLTW